MTTKKAIAHGNLNLGRQKDLTKKINALHKYLRFRIIYCNHKSKINTNELPRNQPSIKVTSIIIPGGESSYIKALLRECLDVLKKYIHELSTHSHYSLSALHDLFTEGIEKCITASKAFDPNNVLSFDQSFKYYVSYDGGWIYRPLSCLVITDKQLNQITEQLLLRSHFFGELAQALQLVQQQLVTRTENYVPNDIWVSETAELDVAQLLLALEHTKLDHKKAGRLQAVFYEKFYGLFGLSAKGHHQRVQHLYRKKIRDSYLHDLAKFIDSLEMKTRMPRKKK